MSTYDGYRRVDFNKLLKNPPQNIVSKMYLYVEIINSSNRYKIQNIISNSSFEKCYTKVGLRRAFVSATQHALVLAVKRYGFNSGSIVNRVLKVGFEIGGEKIIIEKKIKKKVRGEIKEVIIEKKKVTKKRFKRNGKYYVGVWLNGKRGMVTSYKWSSKKSFDTNEMLYEEGFKKDLFKE